MATNTSKDLEVKSASALAVSDSDSVQEGSAAVLQNVKKETNTSTTHQSLDFSGIDEKKVLRKMDMHLIPVLAVLFLLSFLDRGNIGNAKIEGLQTDLNLTNSEYTMCLTVFFFGYCVFEVPSNLMMKRFCPSVWLPLIMVAWGLVMTLMGLVQNYQGLVIARTFLGIAEAGLYPGSAYYITMWYCREEAQLRQALWFSAASVAGAFSGLLAFAIANMDGVGGLQGWRWIFILEGILTVVVAVVAFFVMEDFPETAKFLTEEERAWVIRRLKYQGSKDSRALVAEDGEFSWGSIWAAFTDWQVWLSLLMYFGIITPLYGISFFLPTIINQLGYSSSNAQLLTIPIYATAAVVAVVVSWLSDRCGKRWPFIFFPMCVIVLGYVMTIIGAARGNMPGLVYAGVFLATCGIYPAFPGNVTWLSNNLAGSYKRSAAMAIQIGVGGLGGAIASNVYRGQDSPKFLLGHGFEIGITTLGLIATVVLRISYAKINAKREREGNEMGYSPEELSKMGDRAPTFRYLL